MPKKLPLATVASTFPPHAEFEYFRDHARHPFRPQTNKLQMVNAWWLSEAALLAYAEPSFAEPVFRSAGFRVVQPFAGESTQGYIIHNESFAIVAFRGTQVVKELDTKLPDVFRHVVSDFYTDAKFCLVDSGQGGRVHRGFRHALDEVWYEQVEPYLNRLKRDNRDRPLWFTGHSLGAALATLAADRYGSVQGLYTFGSPLVGDDNFARDFHVNTYRFVNNNDIVARVPPAGPCEPLGVASYQHVGQLKYLNNKGHVIDNPSHWSRLLDHFSGELGHLVNQAGRFRSGWVSELPIDHLNDHAPLFYAIQIWNNYERDLPG